jgi:hypothetical protein
MLVACVWFYNDTKVKTKRRLCGDWPVKLSGKKKRRPHARIEAALEGISGETGSLPFQSKRAVTVDDDGVIGRAAALQDCSV